MKTILIPRAHRIVSEFDVIEAFQDIIKALYKNPRFYVEIDGVKSRTARQETGIRQGCPLSPDLFVVFRTVLFHDVKNDVGEKTME